MPTCIVLSSMSAWGFLVPASWFFCYLSGLAVWLEPALSHAETHFQLECVEETGKDINGSVGKCVGVRPVGQLTSWSDMFTDIVTILVLHPLSFSCIQVGCQQMFPLYYSPYIPQYNGNWKETAGRSESGWNAKQVLREERDKVTVCWNLSPVYYFWMGLKILKQTLIHKCWTQVWLGYVMISLPNSKLMLLEMRGHRRTWRKDCRKQKIKQIRVFLQERGKRKANSQSSYRHKTW